jgi:hypothetical protein
VFEAVLLSVIWLELVVFCVQVLLWVPVTLALLNGDIGHTLEQLIPTDSDELSLKGNAR